MLAENLEQLSLWGDEIKLEPAKTMRAQKPSPEQLTDKEIDKYLKSAKVTLVDKLEIVRFQLDKYLGWRRATTSVLTTASALSEYLDKAKSNNIIVIDTETNNSLDTTTCKLMGLCLYTPGLNAAYVPVNHTDLAGNRLSGQLDEATIYALMSTLPNGIECVFHNAKFDYEVLAYTCGLDLPITWDTMIGARLIDENEPAGLKEQYRMHINQSQEKYSIGSIFKTVKYEYVEPSEFALYAATDADMTYQLYARQKKIFAQPENAGIKCVFDTIEVPAIKPFAVMEMNGLKIDLAYCAALNEKYHAKLMQAKEKLDKELASLSSKISAWRLTKEANAIADGKKSKSAQLEDPINLDSPIQMAILLYDVLKVKPVDKKAPRGTGKNELIKIAKRDGLKFCDYLLEYKKMAKMIDAFLESLPKSVSSRDNKIHCEYNQIGADTGRTSCSSPNFQQIPSKSTDIRCMFLADDGYILVGSDFSQQEPRLLSMYSGDESMINAYKNGRDLYATIGAKVYHNRYEDNLEHNPDGTIFEDGKKRRARMKTLLLGISYGMGVAAVAELIGSSKKEAQDIFDEFYKEFPKVKSWMDKTQQSAKLNGFVEDWAGRRRRLPNIQLKPFEAYYKTYARINPLLDCPDMPTYDSKLAKYEAMAAKTRGYDGFDDVRALASKDGIDVRAHTAQIAEAERQCVNARIQGGAASMTKLAMIRVFNDPEMQKMGFKLLINVHDELIGECKEEYAAACAERLSYLMRTTLDGICPVPFKCDATVSHRWYEEEYCAELLEDYEKLVDEYGREAAAQKFAEQHKGLPDDLMMKVLS